MTTKHAPATPLPWIPSVKGILSTTGNDVAYVYFEFKDTGYIAHAANAYPKLVEALRSVVGLAEAHASRLVRERESTEFAAGAHAAEADCAKVRALLEELGE